MLALSDLSRHECWEACLMSTDPPIMLLSKSWWFFSFWTKVSLLWLEFLASFSCFAYFLALSLLTHSVFVIVDSPANDWNLPNSCFCPVVTLKSGFGGPWFAASGGALWPYYTLSAVCKLTLDSVKSVGLLLLALNYTAWALAFLGE